AMGGLEKEVLLPPSRRTISIADGRKDSSRVYAPIGTDETNKTFTRMSAPLRRGTSRKLGPDAETVDAEAINAATANHQTGRQVGNRLRGCRGRPPGRCRIKSILLSRCA